LNKVSKNNHRPAFALKCDIKKFFDSIDHEILKRIIRNKVADIDVLWLLDEIIDSYSVLPGKGVPIGNLTSQLFANIYLNEFDQFAKNKLKVKFYVRYTDDFVIISDKRGYLGNLLSSIQKFLGDDLRLKLHSQKVSIRKFRQGIDFLGCVILPQHRCLRTKTKKRIFRRLANRIKQYQKGIIEYKTLFFAVQSYLGVLFHINAFQLNQRLLNIFCFEEPNQQNKLTVKYG